MLSILLGVLEDLLDLFVVLLALLFHTLLAFRIGLGGLGLSLLA